MRQGGEEQPLKQKVNGQSSTLYSPTWKDFATSDHLFAVPLQWGDWARLRSDLDALHASGAGQFCRSRLNGTGNLFGGVGGR